jgi:DNA-binding PadR family transcriptional regulator
MAKKRVYWQGPARQPDASVIEATDRLCDEVGMMFRHAQWEAYDTYCAWEAELGAKTAKGTQATALAETRRLRPLAKHYLVPLILSLLKATEMDVYQIDQAIMECVKGRYGFEHGAILPQLYELEKNGIIVGKWKMNPEGQEVKYFRLTPAGLRILERERPTLAEFARLIDTPGWQPG